MSAKTISENTEAIQHLRKILKPNDTVYCVLRHVSSSGMTRRIDFYSFKGGAPRYLSGYMSKAIGLRRHKDGGLIVQGCGMDMGFSCVYDLGRTLFPKGFKVAGIGRNGDTSGHDTDGGYALKSEWL